MTFKRWLKAAHEEGGEEVWQGIVERGLQNLAYGKKNPIASLTDENAVLNPRTSAQEYAGGAVVGGVLGGGQALAASGVNSAAQKANLERAYQETGAAIKQQGMLNDLVQMGLGMGEETSKSAQIIQDKIARGESVSDREVGKLLRGEITEESLPEGSNAKGIREVYEAKREYEQYAEQLREYKRAIRAARRESADHHGAERQGMDSLHHCVPSFSKSFGRFACLPRKQPRMAKWCMERFVKCFFCFIDAFFFTHMTGNGQEKGRKTRLWTVRSPF